MTQRSGFNRHEQNVYFLPILVEDSGPPSLSSTNTLTIHICGCDPGECYTVTLRGFERLTTSNMFPILCPSNQAPSYLPIHLSIYLSIAPPSNIKPIHPCTQPSNYPKTHPPTHLPIYPMSTDWSSHWPTTYPSSNHPATHPSIYSKSTHCLCINPSIRPSILPPPTLLIIHLISVFFSFVCFRWSNPVLQRHSICHECCSQPWGTYSTTGLHPHPHR